MERMPPEVSSDLLDRGLILSGGLAQIPGIANRIHRRIGIPVKIAKNPQNLVVLGTGAILEAYKDFKAQWA